MESPFKKKKSKGFVIAINNEEKRLAQVQGDPRKRRVKKPGAHSRDSIKNPRKKKGESWYDACVPRRRYVPWRRQTTLGGGLAWG